MGKPDTESPGNLLETESSLIPKTGHQQKKEKVRTSVRDEVLHPESFLRMKAAAPTGFDDFPF